jgi:WD40 repeat protein
MSTYSLFNSLTGHTDSVNFLEFSPDGKYLASGSDDRLFHVTNFRSGVSRLSVKASSSPTSLVWDRSRPDTYFVGFANGGVTLQVLGKTTVSESTSSLSMISQRHTGQLSRRDDLVR